MRTLLRKISSRDNRSEQALIKKMKQAVKEDPAVIEKFEEYGVSLDEIDSVEVYFCPLDVSAKTKDRKIYINKVFLGKQDPTHYLAHELVHYLQQKDGRCRAPAEDDYLDRPTENEAFEVQIDFKKRNEGEDEAENYVDDLLDYHDISGRERKEKKKDLLEA